MISMDQFACSTCAQWFPFEKLSEEKQMCIGCTAASSQNKQKIEVKPTIIKRPICKYCKTDIKANESSCERCLKNFKEHGKPNICAYCKLHSAFIGSKCQRCSSSQKKYGKPVKCGKCKTQSAFDHDKARVDGVLLCWLCYVRVQRKLRQEKKKMRKIDVNEKLSRYSPTKPHIPTKEAEQGKVWSELLGEERKSQMTGDDSLRKKAHSNQRKHAGHHKPPHGNSSLDARLAGMKRTFSAPTSPSSPMTPVKKVKQEDTAGTPKSDTEVPGFNSDGNQTTDRRRNGANSATGIPVMRDDNIVLITKLRDEIESLKKRTQRMSQQLIEKDKQLSLVKVEHLNELKQVRSKFQTKEDDYIKTMESFRSKNQDLLKKIAQISKGKA